MIQLEGENNILGVKFMKLKIRLLSCIMSVCCAFSGTVGAVFTESVPETKNKKATDVSNALKIFGGSSLVVAAASLLILIAHNHRPSPSTSSTSTDGCDQKPSDTIPSVVKKDDYVSVTEVEQEIAQSGQTSITNWAGNLSEEKQKYWLKKAVDEFKSHGHQSYFSVTKGFNDELSVRDALVFVAQVNRILGLIPAMAQELDKMGGLRLGVYKDFNTDKKTYVDSHAYTSFKPMSILIAFNEHLLNDLSWRDRLFYEFSGYERKANFGAPASIDQLFEGVVTHELGHVFHFVLISKTDPFLQHQAKYGKPSDASIISSWRQLWSGRPCLYLKMFIDLILKLSKTPWSVPDVKDNILLPWISKYGATQNGEWFAEVFKNTFCGDPTDLGRGMLKFINAQYNTNLGFDKSGNVVASN